MKTAFLICGLSAMVLMGAGCSTERGAASDEYYSNTSGVTASPTMRPGMNPADPRDPNYLNHHTQPPETE